MKRASEGNTPRGGGVRRLSQCYRVTWVMSGEMGNLVVKIDRKENMEEGPMMANTGLFEAWVGQIWSWVRQMGLSRLLQGYQGWLRDT
jgi:hypothetical protein